MTATNSWRSANYPQNNSKPASRYLRSTSVDRLSLIVRTLQHTDLPHPVLSPSTSVIFLSKPPAKRVRNATSLALARLMGPDFILVDEISRKTPAVWTQVSLQLGCNTIAAGLQVRASPKLRVLGRCASPKLRT